LANLRDIKVVEVRTRTGSGHVWVHYVGIDATGNLVGLKSPIYVYS